MIDVRISTMDVVTQLWKDLLRYSTFAVLVIYFTISLLTLKFIGWLVEKVKLSAIKVTKPPGPRPLPLIGSAHYIIEGPTKTLEMMQVKWPAQYGDIYSVKLGPVEAVNISSPELIEVILKSSKLIDKGPSYRFFHPWLGNGLLVSTGQHWKSTRKMLTPAFHFQILDEFFNVFQKQTKILCNVIQDGHIEHNKNKDGNVFINISKIVANCALDSLCEATMGVEVKAQTETSNYVRNLCRMTEIIIQRFSKPWLGMDWIFCLSPIHREQSNLIKYLHNYSENVIKDRWEMRMSYQEKQDNELDEISAVGKYRPALLDTLLDHYPLLNSSGEVIETNKIAIQQEIDTFLFAGHDTTSAAMSWFIYCMARYPEQQRKVWQELNDVYGDDTRECTQEELSRFSYFDCCLKESMRLFTTVPHIERHLTEDVQLGDYLVPAGSNVFILLYRLHHHERFYSDPFDFHPERFSDTNQENGQKKMPHHPYAYIPFSAGPRNCIGQRFALMEMRVVLTTLLRRFEFYWDGVVMQEPVPSFQAILKPLHEINVGARIR